MYAFIVCTSDADIKPLRFGTTGYDYLESWLDVGELPSSRHDGPYNCLGLHSAIGGGCD